VSKPSILNWQRVHGDRAVHYAECAIGVFRTRTAGRRVVLTLNDVAIGNHGDQARARAQADRLIEATAQHLMGRSRRQAAVPQPEATPAPEPAS
jgi:hypothetical protein